MRGLGKWVNAIARSSQLKARRKKYSGRKSLLSEQEPSSGSGESAAVHHAQLSLLSFSDGAKKSDNDPAVGKTVETLVVAGSDGPAQRQEKEARSVGGIPSQ